ncbi:MAG: hypothetical protein LBG95_01840 [Treponema sp.]|jgi:hypothetical protein|nr:hypothetical protein [Treponema sp.]
MTIPLILSLISLCLCVFSFFFFRWYIGQKTAARELLADYRAEVYRLIAEIDAASDRDSLLVEERIKTLKKIIEDTDRRISVYMREQQRSRNGEVMYASLGRGIRAALDSRVPQLEPPPEAASRQEETNIKQEAGIKNDAHSQAKAPSQPVSEALLFPARKSTTEEKMPATGKRKPKKNKLKAQVAELSAQGLSPQQIASRLNLSLAEVDLAMNLLQRSGINSQE